MTMKLAILFSSYGPYHIARLKSLLEHYSTSNKSIFALELARSQEEYPWEVKLEQYNFSVVSVMKDKTLEQTNHLELLFKLNRTLNHLKPNIIAISGYFMPAMLCALLWCILHRKQAILFSESTEIDAPRFWWKELIKRLIITQYKAALVGGQPHQRYLIKLGMQEEAIFFCYDVVGNESFHPDKIKSLPQPIDNSYFLAINRFIPKKNLAFLISSYAEYREKMGNLAWDLVLCGDGELRTQLEKQITDLGLNEYVHLPGFLQQEELLPYFAHAGCFIHASIQEQWGLVVNEAMAAGLPVLVSNRCGCFEDLILEGINGFGFDPENPEELTQLMIKISSRGVNLEVMGQASLEHIQKFSPDYFAQGLMQAVEYASAHS